MQNCCILWVYFFKKYYFLEKLRQLEKKMPVVHQKQNKNVLLHMSWLTVTLTTQTQAVYIFH